MRKTTICLLMSFVSVLFASSHEANAQAYTVTDLKSIPPYYWTTPLGLNASGEVVGASTKSAFPNPSGGLAFLWTKAKEIQSLGSGFASSINSAGDVAGYITSPGHAFLWKHDGTTQDLGTLSGSRGSSHAWAINSAVSIVGDSPPPSGADHPFLWTPTGGMQDLGVLGGTNDAAEAHGINDSGQVVGFSQIGTGNQWDAFSWTQSGGLQNMGPGFAYAVNSSGLIVGEQCCSNATHAQLWQGGTTQDLGTLGGTRSTAYAINGSGTVVGSSTTTTALNPPTHAFIWTQASGMQDLNLQVPASTQQKWVLVSGSAINDAGQIAVQALPVTGTQITHGLLLSPQMNVTLKSSPNPSVVGQTVTFTATVTSIVGPPPDGEVVTFKTGPTVLGTGTLKGGVATFQTSTLTQGTHAISAMYAGDANYLSAKSAVLNQVVNK